MYGFHPSRHSTGLRVGQIWLLAALGLASIGLVGCQEDESTASALLGAEVSASGDVSVENAPMPLFRRLARQLELTAPQREQVREILKREREAMAASGVFAQGREAVHAAMMERRERVAAEISTLLTPEQKVRFDALQEKFHSRLAGGFGRGEYLVRELDLSVEQQAQLQRLFEEKRASMKEMRGRIHSGKARRGELRPIFRAEREKMHARISELLTPEQRVRFERLVAEWREDFGR